MCCWLKSSQQLLVFIQGVTNTTTIKEIYEWAVKHKAENLPVGIKFQDEGGTYPGDTFSAYAPDYAVSASTEYSGDDEYVLLE